MSRSDDCQYVCMRELFKVPNSDFQGGVCSRILFQFGSKAYVFEVDFIVGESTLLVYPLDPRLGKVPAVSAASQNDDGAVVLILDVPDLIHVVDRGEPLPVSLAEASRSREDAKRVLIVDDSITVREAESKILRRLGLEVEMAVDGMDAWEAITSGMFDLIITDVDMPRMTGFELLEKMRQDPRYSRIPVIVLSYKERLEDRDRALALGATHYVLKSEFEDGKLQSCIREIFDK